MKLPVVIFQHSMQGAGKPIRLTHDVSTKLSRRYRSIRVVQCPVWVGSCPRDNPRFSDLGDLVC